MDCHKDIHMGLNTHYFFLMQKDVELSDDDYA